MISTATVREWLLRAGERSARVGDWARVDHKPVAHAQGTHGRRRLGVQEARRRTSDGAWRGLTVSDPIAYFITFRTYGTWLHGDERGSTDRRHNAYDTPLLDPHAGRRRSAGLRLIHPPVTLSKSARDAVAVVIRQVCDHHDWTLHSSNVRSNHVHVVVSAPRTPEQIMIALKS